MSILGIRLMEVLHEREFYELMQQYRNAPVIRQQVVVEAFENVINFVVTKTEELENKNGKTSLDTNS